MSIELKNVIYTYSPGTAYEIHALKDVNLTIPDGQFIGIIGHTGSGKSTLIQHFNALIRPESRCRGLKRQKGSRLREINRNPCKP